MNFTKIGIAGLLAVTALPHTATAQNAIKDDTCLVDLCVDRCTEMYGSEATDFSHSYYCAKGCALMQGGIMTDASFYCTVDEGQERYEYCMGKCPDGSPQEFFRDMCRYGCEFWLAPESMVAATAAAVATVTTTPTTITATTTAPASKTTSNTFVLSSTSAQNATCLNELAQVEACMPVDLNDLDASLECSFCGVEAMGENLENLFDDDAYCSEWRACVNAKCKEECFDVMNEYQTCEVGFDCGIQTPDVSNPNLFGSTVPPPWASSPEYVDSSADPTYAEACSDEIAAIEACTPTDLAELEAYLECTMCAVDAIGDDFSSLNEDDYCDKWIPCAKEKCPEKCQEPLNALQACESGWDCLSRNSNADGAAGVAVQSAAVTSFMASGVVLVIAGANFLV